jgi:ATP-dependent Clp protease ATP-binding subunit ClpA
MFERFTERARQVVVLAQEEARVLRHNYIGTEHLLLGLLREADGVAARVLGTLEVTLEEVRGEVTRIVGEGDNESQGQIPFTPRAKKVLEYAVEEAQHMGHSYVGTEHLLLGLLKEGEETSGGHKTWTIVQLLNSKELFDEGRAMKHCVASYSGSCSAGRCSIWSLRMYTKEGGFRCVTIELDRANQIIQVRGPRERYATAQEGRIIQQWAAKNNLSIASYVFCR